jgi:hypothetical protein
LSHSVSALKPRRIRATITLASHSDGDLASSTNRSEAA